MAGSDPGQESRRDRKRLARQAGLGRLSFISALAGVLVAYGAFALLVALVGAVAVAIGSKDRASFMHNQGPCAVANLESWGSCPGRGSP